MSSEASRGVADGFASPHTYIPNQGYDNNDIAPPRRQISLGQYIRNIDDLAGLQDSDDELHENDLEEDFDAELDREDLVDDEDLAISDPKDLTKVYNRQRRLDEAVSNPKTPSWQYPRANPQPQKTRKDIDLRHESAAMATMTQFNEKDIRRAEDEVRDAPSLRDKADRATSDQVLDPKTRMILFNMIQSNIISEMEGTISTGKEANVYHAIATPQNSNNQEQTETHVAVKIYKTAILVFKDREKYVNGEFRFRKGFKGSDARAMVKLWAEKEWRNLKRIHASGIPCPEPLYLKRHVLMMNYIGQGKKSKAAPRLKDVAFADDDNPELRWRNIYIEVLAYMRMLLQVCKLVHADLSEYNMLYFENRVYIIDVSQSVENDHPRSRDFLRMDITNVTDFFRRKGVNVLPERKVYDFVNKSVGTEEGAALLDALKKEIDTIMAERTEGDDENENEVDNAVFQNQYIPQTLDEVYDAERDARTLQHGGRDTLVYKDLLAPSKSKDLPAETGKATKQLENTDAENNGAPFDPGTTTHPDGASQPSDDDSANTDDDNASASSHSTPGQPRGKRFQDKAEKKAHKEKIKAENRERREKKLPKAEKKKLIKDSARRKR